MNSDDTGGGDELKVVHPWLKPMSGGAIDDATEAAPFESKN